MIPNTPQGYEKPIFAKPEAVELRASFREGSRIVRDTLRCVISKQTVMWSAIGVAAVALVTASVVMTLPSVERTAAPTTTTASTASASAPDDPRPDRDALTMANRVVNAIASVDNAALQSLLCAGASQGAKAPLTNPPGGWLLGARQTRDGELVTTVKLSPRLDLIAVVQEQQENDWCLVDLDACPLTETGEFDLRAALESGDYSSMTRCEERPLRIE